MIGIWIGFEDKADQCPDTPLTELVDLTGCTIKSLKSPHHFDIALGEKYMEKQDMQIYTTTLQMDYYYRKLSLQLSTSYFNREVEENRDSGLNDTYLNGYWKFKPVQNLTLRVGGGLSIPTYDSENNELDYTVATYLTYRYGKFSLLGGVGETFIGDSDRNGTSYSDALFYSLGVGYFVSDSLYSSLSYSSSSSIFNSNDSLEINSLGQLL